MGKMIRKNSSLNGYTFITSLHIDSDITRLDPVESGPGQPLFYLGVQT